MPDLNLQLSNFSVADAQYFHRLGFKDEDLASMYEVQSDIIDLSECGTIVCIQ